jgi:hypothetical protein
MTSLTSPYQILDKYTITKDIQSSNNNNIVLSMLYAEICPKVRRHNALTPLPGHALCLLTLGHISAYNMDNTILLYKQWVNNSMAYNMDNTILLLLLL